MNMKIIICLFLSMNLSYAKAPRKTLRIGFFLGGRTGSIYRMVKDEGKKLNFDVQLITKDIRNDNFYVIKKYPTKVDGKFSKATGDELYNLILQGKADAALIGETSFVKMIQSNAPIVAIAETGHDVKGQAGHAMVFRKDVPSDPQKWKGLKFGARRSSGGDTIVLKEFLMSYGLDPDKDVNLIDGIDDDKIKNKFKKGKIDAAYVHLATVRGLVSNKKYNAKLFRPLDWLNPEMSLALLVVSRDFLEKNRPELKKFMKDYVDFLKREKSKPLHVKQSKSYRGIQIEEDFEGMNFPQYYDCPYVRNSLLTDWQKLLLKHKVVSKETVVDGYIDNSLFDCK